MSDEHSVSKESIFSDTQSNGMGKEVWVKPELHKIDASFNTESKTTTIASETAGGWGPS